MFRANDKHSQRSLIESTEWMNPKVRDKLEKSWAPIFYEYVFSKIDEKPFAVLYGTTGKPNFPVNILLSLEYIKHIRDCNDLELLDAFSFDYQVSYALGLHTLGEKHLAERTLYYFRERIYHYCASHPGGEDLIFGQFINLLHVFVEKAGTLLDKQRTDTSYFTSNIKKAGRISLAYDVLAKAVRVIPEAERTEALRQVLEPDFKTDVLYRAKAQEGDSKLAMLLKLCDEALGILKAQAEPSGAEERRVLERFIDEQSVMDRATGRRIPKPNKEISSSSLQSAHDEDATYRKKGNNSYSGFVLSATETCNRNNDVQFLTDYAVKPNNVSDQEILEERLPVIRDHTGCTDMYADGGFHSEDVNQVAAENGIEMHLTNMCGTRPTKKVPASDFDIDRDTYIINKCPAGHVPTRAGVSKGQTSAHFPHEVCSGCELFGQCHSKKQAKDCVVRINIKAVDVGQSRAKMEAERKENTSMRAGVEGVFSAEKRKGQDKLNVRGVAKSTIVTGLKQTCQNIKRFTKYMLGGYKKKNALVPPDGIHVFA